MIANKNYIESYKKWMLGQGYSLGTVIAYIGHIKRYVGNGVDVNQKTVNIYRESHMDTVSSGALKSFFKYLNRKHNFPGEVLSYNFDRNKSTKKFPESISVDEVTAIINHMPNLRLKYFTIFLFELGLRVSEALKIKWEDINFIEWIKDKSQYGQLKIKKTKRGFRTIPIKPQLMTLLYDLPNLPKNQLGQPIGNVVFDLRVKAGLEGIEDFISRKQYSNEQNLFDYLKASISYYHEVLYKVSKKAIGRRVHSHLFRHSKSIFLLNNGVTLDVLKEFLGHASLTSTEIYAKASSKKVENQLRQFDNYTKEITKEQTQHLNTTNNI